MKQFKITTITDCWTEYVVEAETQQEARTKFFDGEWISEEDVDFRNETIEDVEEIEEVVEIAPDQLKLEDTKNENNQ